MIDFAMENDRQALKNLWRECFGDEESYINFFFEKMWNPQKSLVARNGFGTPVAMLTMIDLELKAGKNIFGCQYIYAVATAKAFRGKGLARALINRAFNVAQAKGQSFSCLVPQGKELFDFYKKLGFKITSTLNKTEIIQNGEFINDITDCSKEQFIKLRKKYQNSLQNVILHNDYTLSYIYDEKILTKAKVFLVGKGDYIICYKDKNELIVKETSLDENRLSSLADKLKEITDTKKITAFLKGDLKGMPYGMGVVLDGAFKYKKNIYMNLMFD